MCTEITNNFTFCSFVGAAKPHQYLDILCNTSQNGLLVLSCGNNGKTEKNSAPFVVCCLVLLLIGLAIKLISPQGNPSDT
jgi:hypothetical protein